MSDQSYLDKKYFITMDAYNCPFCNRGSVGFTLENHYLFNWSEDKFCHVYFVECDSCRKKSMHLSYEKIHKEIPNTYRIQFINNIDIDSNIFYSVPTSFFVMDNTIPKILRELITEAEGCLKMNYLTGASACMRKAIYELTIIKMAEGDNYEEKIKFLKKTNKNADPDSFDILCNLKDMTSDKIHEQSWDMWDSNHLQLFIETLKSILHEIYVIPEKRKDGSKKIRELLKLAKNKSSVKNETKSDTQNKV